MLQKITSRSAGQWLTSKMRLKRTSLRVTGGRTKKTIRQWEIFTLQIKTIGTLSTSIKWKNQKKSIIWILNNKIFKQIQIKITKTTLILLLLKINSKIAMFLISEKINKSLSNNSKKTPFNIILKTSLLKIVSLN